MSDTMIVVMRRMFEPTVTMLQQLIEVCPDDFWVDSKNKYWRHVFHAATSMKFWFRQEKGEEFSIPDFGRDIKEALDEECADYPTKEEMTVYLESISDQAFKFIDDLTDDGLLKPCVLYDKITKADVILMQIRHVQHHVGYCNSILNSNNLKALEWV